MMKRAASGILISLVTACMVLLGSCDSGYDCGIEKTSYNRIGFYNIDANGIESQYKFPEAITVSLVVNGKDSVVINHLSNASELKVPMSYTHSCDTVVFSYESSATDTLYVNHENIPYFISMECGLAMYHRILSVEHTNAFIDSIAIKNDYVNFDYNENIKLYLVQ
ncbi:MAG: hypothetical protein J6V23_02915 [Bacteroidaceae bacterium]|nr:hypothetical protein [Bacteroidaceae bacterium]